MLKASDICNMFSGRKTEIIYGPHQHPFNRCIDYEAVKDRFAINIPWSTVFSAKPESWGDFKKSRKDYDAIAHIVALQFIAEAVQNSRHMGTKLQAGEKNDFYIWINNRKHVKIDIVVEKLVKRLCAADGSSLPRHILTSEENAVGIRIFFFSYDPDYKFANVLMRQLTQNRKALSSQMEDSDDEDSNDDERRGGERRGNSNTRGRGDKIALDDDEADEDDDEDDEFGKRFKKKRNKRMTRTAKLRKTLDSKHSGPTLGKAKFTPNDYPDRQFLHVTDAHVLGSVLFDPQLDTMRFSQLSDLKALNYDLGSNASEMRLELLNFDEIIRQSERLGCDPAQCNPQNYQGYDQSVLPLDDDDDDDDIGESGSDDSESAQRRRQAPRSSRRREHDSDMEDSESSEEDSIDAEERAEAERNRMKAKKRHEEMQRASGDKEIVTKTPTLTADEERAATAMATANRRGLGQRRGGRKIFSFNHVKLLCWSVHSRDFTATKLMNSYFPWYPHTIEYLEEKLLSCVVKCHRMRLYEPDKVTALENEIIRTHSSEDYTGDVNRKKSMQMHGIYTAGEVDRTRNMQEAAADPMESLSDLFMEMENAIFHIYHDNEKTYQRYMKRMRDLAFRHMHRILDSNDPRIPDSVLVVLDYVREHELRHLCLDTNMITNDLSPCLNQMVHYLLQLETLQISTTHFYIYEVMNAIFSAYLSKKRTRCELKNNIMLHGPPGTGKSKVITTAADHLIADSTDSVTARSLLSMINPKSRNFTAELYDEGAAMYDTQDGKLSAQERKSKRIEQSAMTRQQIDYQYTAFHPETKKRMVIKIKMPYNHVKIASTNVPPKRKRDAMDDRWKHITIMSQRRMGRDLVNYQTAMDTRENHVHEATVKHQREHTQILMLFSAIANQFCALPTPNMDTLRIRLSQTLGFLKKNAPNAKFRVRDAIRMLTEGMTATFMYANLLMFGSELSPFRRIEKDEKYVQRQRERGLYDARDHRNYRLTYKDYQHEDMAVIGPHLVCTDDTAIRILTGVVMNLLHPMHHMVLCAIAKEYGNFDVQEVLDYYDDESEQGYHERKGAYEKFENDLEKNGGIWFQQSKTRAVCDEIIKTTNNNNYASSTAVRETMGPRRSFGVNAYVPENGHIKEKERAQEKEDTSALRLPSFPKSTRNDQKAKVGKTTKDRHPGKFIYGHSGMQSSTLPFGSRRKQTPTQIVNSASGGVGDGERKELPVFVVNTWLYENERQTQSKKLPEFRSLHITSHNSVSYNPTFLKINMNEETLLQRCHDLCRNNGWNYDEVKAILNVYKGRNVSLRHVPNIQHGLHEDRDYIRHKIASKMDDSNPLVIKQSGTAISTADNCIFLAVDLLLESPNRVVEQLVRSFEYQHTQQRTVLLGVPSKKTPFCPVSMVTNPKKGKRIVFPNVKHNNRNIYTAINNGNHIGDRAATIEEPNIDSPEIAVEGDLEAYAIERHFKAEGYDLRYKHLYLPSTNHDMMRAIYADMDPKGERYGLDDERVEEFLTMAAMKYCLEQGVDPHDEQCVEQANKIMDSFLLMCRVLVRARSTYKCKEAANKLLSYPVDFMIPGYDRKLKTAYDQEQEEKKKKHDSVSKEANEQEEQEERELLKDLGIATKKKRQKIVKFVDQHAERVAVE